MEILNTYSHIKGFNYQPSYAAHGLEIWKYFKPEIIEREVGLGKEYFPGINTLRIWLSWDAYLSDPNMFRKNFEIMLDILEKNDLKAIAMIFSAWHSIPTFGGVTNDQLNLWDRFFPEINQPFLNYIKDIVGEHADDERILLWDLCNEPPNEKLFIKWLSWVYDSCKFHEPKAPLCIGNIPDLEMVRATLQISDVITWHPYWAWNTWRKNKEDYIKFLDDSMVIAVEANKPLVASEVCWGAMDDKKRAEVIEFELSELKSRGIGWIAHLLHYTRVADGHRPLYGYVSPAGYMAFIESDGSLRPYHDVFNKY